VSKNLKSTLALRFPGPTCSANGLSGNATLHTVSTRVGNEGKLVK